MVQVLHANASRARKLWALLKSREKVFVLWYFMLPALNRLSLLAAFGVSLKMILHASKNEVTNEWITMAASSMAGCLIAFAVFQLLKSRSESRIRRLSAVVVRRIIGGELMRTASVEIEEKKRILALHRLSGPILFAQASKGLIGCADFVATSFLLLLLLVFVAYCSIWIGVVVVVVGVILLLFLRKRVGNQAMVSLGDVRRAKKQLSVAAASIVKRGEGAANYVNNDFDRIRTQDQKGRKSREGKIVFLSAILSAVVLLSIFFLVVNGAFEGLDPVLLLIFVFSIRLLTINARICMLKWSSVLQLRKSLVSLVSLIDPGGEFPEYKGAVDPEEDEGEALVAM